jgi:hypothetical protein
MNTLTDLKKKKVGKARKQQYGIKERTKLLYLEDLGSNLNCIAVLTFP